MKIRAVLLLLWMLAAQHMHGQSISNVNTEAVGDKVVIRYDLADPKSDHLFEVALYFSKDNFSQTLRSVSGNGIGPTVSSGPDRVIIWDVLKDVKELSGECTFEVRALMKPLVSGAAAVVIASDRSMNVTNKDEAFPIISSTINDYINEAKDFKDAFQMLGVQATESRQAHGKLTDAVDQYNRAFEKLNKERFTFEKYVASFWKNDVETLEFKSLMDYLLGDVHGVNILTLNQKISTINDIAGSRVKRPGEKKQELEKDISEEVLRLDKQLQELERRTNRILHTLSQD